MGLFDRFRQKPGESDDGDKSFFLDADKSSSLGDVDFMRRSTTAAPSLELLTTPG